MQKKRDKKMLDDAYILYLIENKIWVDRYTEDIIQEYKERNDYHEIANAE